MDYSCGDSSGLAPAFPFNLPLPGGKGRTEHSDVNIEEKAESLKHKAKRINEKVMESDGYFFSLIFTKTFVSQGLAALEKINESAVKFSTVYDPNNNLDFLSRK